MTANWKLPHPPAPGNSAREPRVAKLVSVELTSARVARARVVVRNLSPHGMGVRADIDLLPCESVTVHLPDGRDVAGIVRWARKNSFGLSLQERIDPAELKPRTVAEAGIVTRDTEPGFHRMKHQPTPSRTGFQRSHRDEILQSSNWRGAR